MSERGHPPVADGRRGLSVADAVAAALVVVSLAAFAVIRVQCIDVPWHLATERLARALGHWPTRNTFSYTFPDHPLYQQYPVFQATLGAVYRLAGWGGLSVLGAVGWATVYLLFVRWAGRARLAIALHLPWTLALWALQRRMILRPDLYTMLALGAMLLLLDAYRRGRRFALVFVPLVHLLWVNSHQLFPVSLAVQGLFVAHLWLARRAGARALGVDPTDAAVPILPAVASFLASVALCFATPLGADILRVTIHTTGSLAHMRDQVGEFARIWNMPLERALALATGVPAALVLWHGRRRWSPFDVGLLLISLALTLVAVRGLMFFGVVCIAALQRAVERGDATTLPPLPIRPAVARALRGVGVALTLLLGGGAVLHQGGTWPSRSAARNLGSGATHGGWADEATAFVRRASPPGHMMNMAWTSGNDLIWGAPRTCPRLRRSALRVLSARLPARGGRRLRRRRQGRRARRAMERHLGLRRALPRRHSPARAVTLLRRGWSPSYVDSAPQIPGGPVP